VVIEKVFIHPFHTSPILNAV